MSLAREGYPFVLIALGLSIALTLFLGVWGGVASLVLPLYVLYFFRDPERVPPPGEEALVSPADGKILSISEVNLPADAGVAGEEDHLRGRARRISIFMSLLSVHVNRIPVSGRVKRVRYTPGRFLIGFAEKASQDNERNAVLLEGLGGQEVLMVQVAGLVARRIVCRLREGDEVARGERFGLIRFGSRVDLYLPIDSEVLVKKGQRVRAGETPLARFS